MIRMDDLVIMMPCYNDWEALRLLLQQLDATFAATGLKGEVIVVDDCSSEPCPHEFASGPFQALKRIEVLRLRRNMGHQRAICIGLSHVYEHHDGAAVLVMDADGEDRPEDIPLMLSAFEENRRTAIVFAERTRRSEDVVFRIGYACFCMLHRALTGIRVKVGNFSMIPREHLASLVVISESWNHHAAAVFRSRIKHVGVPAVRGARLAGKSNLSLVSHVVHGLSAIAVFFDVVGVRLIFIACGSAAILMLFSIAVFIVKYATSLAIPGWATTTLGLLLIILTQMFVLLLGLTGLVLFNRNNLSFIPIRDYKYFAGQVTTLYPPHE
jgi:glycosyltransferase involved in cell wall biosynthesis